MVQLKVVPGGNPEDVYADKRHLKLVEFPPTLPAAERFYLQPPQETTPKRPTLLKVADWCLKQATLIHYRLDQYYTARPEPDEPEMVIGRHRW